MITALYLYRNKLINEQANSRIVNPEVVRFYKEKIDEVTREIEGLTYDELESGTDSDSSGD